jgi:hypothetical protein
VLRLLIALVSLCRSASLTYRLILWQDSWLKCSYSESHLAREKILELKINLLKLFLGLLAMVRDGLVQILLDNT